MVTFALPRSPYALFGLVILWKIGVICMRGYVLVRSLWALVRGKLRNFEVGTLSPTTVRVELMLLVQEINVEITERLLLLDLLWYGCEGVLRRLAAVDG